MAILLCPKASTGRSTCQRAKAAPRRPAQTLEILTEVKHRSPTFSQDLVEPRPTVLRDLLEGVGKEGEQEQKLFLTFRTIEPHPGMIDVLAFIDTGAPEESVPTELSGVKAYAVMKPRMTPRRMHVKNKIGCLRFQLLANSVQPPQDTIEQLRRRL